MNFSFIVGVCRLLGVLSLLLVFTSPLGFVAYADEVNQAQEVKSPSPVSATAEQTVEASSADLDDPQADAKDSKKKKRSRPERELYPHSGAIIKHGDDIQVCQDAKRSESYVGGKKSYKFIHHGKDGWLFRSVDFREDYDLSDESLGYFKRLSKALKSKGQTLIILYQPPRAIMSVDHIDTTDMPADYKAETARKNFSKFIKKLNDNGVLAVDLSDAPPKPDYFYSGDLHWSNEGSKWSAQQIADMIKKLPVYSEIEKIDFKPEIIDQGIPDRGGMEEVIQSICKVNIEAVSGPVWATSQESKEDMGADSLLGDVAFPAVTVVGTSNTALDYRMNFVGSLKQALRADVYNAAIMGGGFGSSSYRYYASDEYQDFPPKVIVWEFLPQHNYNAPEAIESFRQMIPATFGACSEEDALATYSADLSQFAPPPMAAATVTADSLPPINAADVKVDEALAAIADDPVPVVAKPKKPEVRFSIFSNMVGKSLKDTYVYLEMKEPTERNVNLEILYADGEADNADLSRNTRTANNGKYYFELNRDSPLFFQIVTDIPEGQVTARLCKYPSISKSKKKGK